MSFILLGVVMKMQWVPEYNTGIDVIDDQHKRILDYINEIDGINANLERDRGRIQT